MAGRPLLRRARRAAVALAVVAVLIGGDLLLRHPASPLPRWWSPLAPLRLDDPVTPVTHLKLWFALGNERLCRAALAETGAGAETLPDFVESESCHIHWGVRLSRVGGARMTPVETRCDVALRLAFWERHGLRPAALAVFGEGIARIEHRSSYSCRTIRTGHGPSDRMSLHATAEAIDIAGVVLESGRRVSLVDGWNGAADEQAFLRTARDSACDWFKVTLGPDYNALHADHFHLQARGWGLCR